MTLRLYREIGLKSTSGLVFLYEFGLNTRFISRFIPLGYHAVHLLALSSDHGRRRTKNLPERITIAARPALQLVRKVPVIPIPTDVMCGIKFPQLAFRPAHWMSRRTLLQAFRFCYGHQSHSPPSIPIGRPPSIQPPG